MKRTWWSFQSIWCLKFDQFGGRISAHLLAEFGQFSNRISAHLLAEFWPICWPNLDQFSGRISAHLAAEFGPIWRPKFGPFGSWSSKFFISFLTTFIFGLIFGLSKQTKFRASLPERKCTGNSGPLFSGFGSDFRENTPDFENVTGTHCLI